MITWHEIAKEGYPKEDGQYIVNQRFDNNANSIELVMFYVKLPSEKDMRFSCDWEKEDIGKPAFIATTGDPEEGYYNIKLGCVTHWSETNIPD